MVDLNNPTTPVTPDMTPTPDPMPAAAPTYTTAPTPEPVIAKKKKSKLWLLVLLLLIGGGYVYYTYFMNAEPAPVVTTPMPEMTTGMNETTGDVVTDTGATMSGDMMSDAEDDNAMDHDTTRRMDLLEIAGALSTYFEMNSAYPTAETYEQSVLMYMTTIPTDPMGDLWPSFNNKMVSGYVYSPLMRAGKANGGMLLMAKVDTVEGANWIDADPALTQISNISRADAATIEKMICTSITVDETTVDSLKNCTASMNSDKLRYIYIK